jgi:hypothetical protein
MDGITLTVHYVDVYHPDGTFKYQVELEEIPICDELGSWNQTALDDVLAELNAADAAKLVKYSDGFNVTEVGHELIKCSAKAFKGMEVIDYHQMCGEFDWEYRCIGTPPNCSYEWRPTCMNSGYKVVAYSYDKNGMRSANLTNYFEYICMAKVEVDFNLLDFENVLYRTHKWIEGNDIFDSPIGPACKPVSEGGTNPLCHAPTIRNIGNMPVSITVYQDDMNFGFTGLPSNPDYNVQWDARLGTNAISVFDPYETETLDGILGLCNTQEISFSIFVEKPVTYGNHTGTVEIEPIPIIPYPVCE